MRKTIGTLYAAHSAAGSWYEFVVPGQDGEEFASGTAPTLPAAIDMLTEYATVEWGNVQP